MPLRTNKCWSPPNKCNYFYFSGFGDKIFVHVNMPNSACKFSTYKTWYLLSESGNQQDLLKYYLWLQIFPVNIKGLAGSVATLVNWFGAWLCSYTFNFFMSWSSYGKQIQVMAFSFILFKGVTITTIIC